MNHVPCLQMKYIHHSLYKSYAHLIRVSGRFGNNNCGGAKGHKI